MASYAVANTTMRQRITGGLPEKVSVIGQTGNQSGKYDKKAGPFKGKNPINSVNDLVNSFDKRNENEMTGEIYAMYQPRSEGQGRYG